MSLFDPLNLGGIWCEINNLRHQVYDNNSPLLSRISRVEVRVSDVDKNSIPDLYNKFDNPEWGAWRRIVTLEEENKNLKQRANELEQRVRHLEGLAANLDKYLFDAVNHHLGNVK